MAVRRMDHVSIVVRDLEAAIAFFRELGLELEGRTRVSGAWVDRIARIDGVSAEIAMMRTPDGHGRLELTRYAAPDAVDADPGPETVQAVGLRSVMFAVDDVDEAVARLRAHGGELMGEIVDYEGVYRLCYVRGPEGVIVALAEELRRETEAAGS